jgi:hypothetical protein
MLTGTGPSEDDSENVDDDNQAQDFDPPAVEPTPPPTTMEIINTSLDAACNPERSVTVKPAVD